MRKSAVALLLCLLLGCASGPKTKASGDSSASIKSGDIITETITTTAPDGTVTTTVTETCESCALEEVVGGKGSIELYKFGAQTFSAILSMGAFLFQVLD